MISDGIDMAFRFCRVSRRNRHIMPYGRKAKGAVGKNAGESGPSYRQRR